MYRKGESKPIIGGFVGEPAFEEIIIRSGESFRLEEVFYTRGWPDLAPGDYELRFFYNLRLLFDGSLIKRYEANYPHEGPLVPWR